MAILFSFSLAVCLVKSWQGKQVEKGEDLGIVGFCPGNIRIYIDFILFFFLA